MKLLCRLFGHCWTLFDGDWCGVDQWRCARCGTIVDHPTKERAHWLKALRVKAPPCWF